MTHRVNLVFLYSEVMGYTEAGINAIVKNYNATVSVVSWDKNKLTPFKLRNEPNVTYYDRSQFNNQELINLVRRINPIALYVSGRMDKGYLHVASVFKGKGIKIICGLDNQWLGRPRQYVAILLSRWLYKRYFDIMWVAGSAQMKYAKLLGYNEHQIIKHVYTADVSLFHQAYCQFKALKRSKFPRNFYFVGRFVDRKGLDILVKAFSESLQEINHDWTLTLIGQGELLPSLLMKERVVVKPFLQPAELVKEIQYMGVFCLPSRFEAWGVVLHEFAAAGLPLISSDKCGAAELFVEHNKNGYIFKSNSVSSLKDKLIKIILKADEELIRMGDISNTLGNKITPKTFADSLFSIIDKK